MAIPTSPSWNLAFFDAGNLSSLLGLGASDLSLSPGGSPYFTFADVTTPQGPYITVRSDDGTLAEADFNVAVPSRYTIEMVLRFPEMPDNTGDLSERRLGFTMSDNAGRGVSVYFSKTGVAVSRIDDYGSVTALPDTSALTSEVDRGFRRVRIAVDGGLGRAYVYAGTEASTNPPLLFIIPVGATPGGVGDRLRLFAKGSVADPASYEFKELRFSSGLVIPNFPPTANPGQDRVSPAGQAVRLDGRGSFDPEGAPLTYLWRVIDAPFGSIYAHDNSNGSTMDDGDGDGLTNRLSFLADSLPDWVSPGDVLVIDETRHVLDTVDDPGGFLTVTTDSIGDAYSGTAFRILRQSLLVGADTETPYAVPDIAGLYRAELIVNDGETSSEAAEVLMSVVGSRAPLGIEPDVSQLKSAVGDDWTLIENRDVFTEAWCGVAQIMSGKLLEAWQYHYNYSIGDVQSTLQKKWVAYRTLIPEEDHVTATIEPRYGHLLSTHNYAAGDPAITGRTLVVEYFDGDGATETAQIEVTFTADDLATAISDINTALAGTGIEAASLTRAGQTRLIVRSYSRAFRFLLFGTANTVLGFESDTFSRLSGTEGLLVTDRTYRVDDGLGLLEYGVRTGDLLVLNNGQSFIIERTITAPTDPVGSMRVVTRESLPFDASATWEIPSLVRSETVDYERAGAYPGDLVKIEVYDTTTSVFTDTSGTIVAQKGQTLGVRLDLTHGAFRDSARYDLRLLGVKRRKSVAIDETTVSIPQLQDLIPQAQNPQLWRENIDYYLEPFYRNEDGSAVPVLQFHDSVFIDKDIEPPDILWAELTLFDNEPNVENLFGALVEFTRDNAAGFGVDADFPYVSAVAGLLYAYQQGPKVRAMEVGLNILFGQPFAEVDGIITEIRNDFTPRTGRILVQDDDGFDPPRTDVVRSYIYNKDPRDESSTSGLAINPETGVAYVVGDKVVRFGPLAGGVDIQDYVNSDWYIPFVRSGLMTELEKFFYFTVSFNLDIVDLVNLFLIQRFITRIEPTYTHPILLGIRNHEDDVDVTDVLGFGLTMSLLDAFCPGGAAHSYDDFRGDGTLWSSHDDGASFYDGLVDCPEDYIEFVLSLDWAGGAITYDSIFALDTDVVDVDGTLGPPGGTFTPTYDMSLDPGVYTVTLVVDSGRLVLPS